MGIVAIVAENGKIAVEKFTEFIHKGYQNKFNKLYRFLFELILMDIIMPEMGGYESTTLIRKIEEQAKLQAGEKHFICGFSAQVNESNKY
jgi:CheY-like chemotaxis protein